MAHSAVSLHLTRGAKNPIAVPMLNKSFLVLLFTLSSFSAKAQLSESCSTIYDRHVLNTEKQKLLQGSIESDDDGNILALKHDALSKENYVKLIALFNEWIKGQGINYWDPSDSHASFEIFTFKNSEGVEIGYEFYVRASDLRSSLFALVENHRIRGYFIRGKRDDHRLHRDMCRE